MKSKLSWLWLSLLVIVADQASKYWAEHVLGPYGRIKILPVFDFSLAHNTGAAFSFLSNAGGAQHFLFGGLAVLVSGWLAWSLSRLESHERHIAIAYSLVLAGAMGNVIDRAVYQYVVDFIHWYYQGLHFPHFNVADMSIFIGAMLMLSEAFNKPFLNGPTKPKI